LKHTIDLLLIAYLHLESVESVWRQVGDNVTDLESNADRASIATTVGRKKLQSEKKNDNKTFFLILSERLEPKFYCESSF
jgi:hypothetical protein